ncbi:MAG: dCMP deaminase family protein [Firmicutes bacterium]|nr:dCMP deaminase family protein [Bacillota bacterium]
MDKWDKRFLDMATHISEWSSCIRRHVGAVIVKDKRILATGYNGAPSGVKSCEERGTCMRQDLGIESGKNLEIGYAVHAEQNAIIQAAKFGVSVEGAVLYCTHQPCTLCSKIIINSGIKKIIYIEGYPDDFSRQVLAEAKVELIKVSQLK